MAKACIKTRARMRYCARAADLAAEPGIIIFTSPPSSEQRVSAIAAMAKASGIRHILSIYRCGAQGQKEGQKEGQRDRL